MVLLFYYSDGAILFSIVDALMYILSSPSSLPHPTNSYGFLLCPYILVIFFHLFWGLGGLVFLKKLIMILKKLLTIVCVYICGDQKTNLWSRICPSTFMWVPGTELGYLACFGSTLTHWTIPLACLLAFWWSHCDRTEMDLTWFWFAFPLWFFSHS